MIEDAKQDIQTMTRDWDRTDPLIAGVALKPTRHILTGSSVTTETYRQDWAETGHGAGHIIHVNLYPGAISAWHCHEMQTDCFFVIHGMVRLVLFDDREGSKTRGLLNSFRLGAIDPCLVRIPTKVWHGVKNIGTEHSIFLNMTDRVYCYENPDEWRLPPDTDKIPYDFLSGK